MNFELDLLHWFQDIRNTFLNGFFTFFTLFGEEVILIVILGFIYWSYDKKIGERMGFTIFISLALNSLIKIAVHRPRPFMTDPTIEPLRTATAGGYSFPSGHTQSAATLFFSLYYFIKKRWLLIVAIVITTLVALSRMYLGVHYLSDVVVGAGFGLLIAWLAGRYLDKIKQMQRVYNILLVLLGLTAVGLLTFNVIHHLNAGVFDTVGFYTDSKDVMTMLATIIGFIVAVGYEKKHVGFANHKHLLKNIARFVLGLAIILGLRFGLKYAFGWIVDPEALASGEMFKGIVAALLDFLRYFLILFVGIGLYPKLFKTLNL